MLNKVIASPDQLVKIGQKYLHEAKITCEMTAFDDEDKIGFLHIYITKGKWKNKVKMDFSMIAHLGGNYITGFSVGSIFPEFPIGRIIYKISGDTSIYPKNLVYTIEKLIRDPANVAVHKYFKGSLI